MGLYDLSEMSLPVGTGNYLGRITSVDLRRANTPKVNDSSNNYNHDTCLVKFALLPLDHNATPLSKDPVTWTLTLTLTSGKQYIGAGQLCGILIKFGVPQEVASKLVDFDNYGEQAKIVEAVKDMQAYIILCKEGNYTKLHKDHGVSRTFVKYDPARMDTEEENGKGKNNTNKPAAAPAVNYDGDFPWSNPKTDDKAPF